MESAVALNLYARWGVTSHVPESSVCKPWQAVPRFVLEVFSRSCRLPLSEEIAAALDMAFSGESVVISLTGLEDAAHAIQGRGVSSLVRELCLVHAVAHALSQPILDVNEGPLVVVLVASAESAVSACEILAASSDIAGLLLHDTTSGLVPAMPQNRRPDIAVGTARSLIEFAATRFYAGGRASLMVVWDPIELVSFVPAAWDAMQHLFATPRQVVAISRVADAEQSSPTARWASKHISLVMARTPKIVRVNVPEAPSADVVETARRQPRSEATEHVLLWNISPGDETAFTSWPAAIAEEMALDDRGRDSVSFVGLDVAPNALGSANALEAAAGLGLLSLQPRVGMSVSPTNGTASRLCRSVSGRVFGARRLVATVVFCDPCSFDVHALVTAVPRTLLFRNCCKLSTVAEAPSPRSVASDIVAECNKFGAVTSSAHWISDDSESETGFDADAVEYHDGFRIFVEFDCFMGAEAALSKLHGVKFDDLVLHVTFFESARYSSSELAPSAVGEEDLDAVELM